MKQRKKPCTNVVLLILLMLVLVSIQLYRYAGKQNLVIDHNGRGRGAEEAIMTREVGLNHARCYSER